MYDRRPAGEVSRRSLPRWSRTRWAGVGRVWTWINEEAKQHALSLSRIVSNTLLPWLDETFVRLDAEIKINDLIAQRWAESFGFYREATMRSYGLNGKGDFYLYARIRHGA